MPTQYALVLEGTNQLRVEDRALIDGELGDHEALVETRYVAICGTDLEVIDGSSDRARPPLVLGHEWAGRVVAVGDQVDRSLVGAFVAGDNAVGRGREVGFELPGGFASQFTTLARNLHPLPPLLHGPAGCLLEPLAVSVRACRKARLRASDSVLVVGDGVIGILIARIASLAAAAVTLVGRHEDRLATATRLGVPDATMQPDLESARTVVFEASGKPSGLKTAIGVAAAGARIVLVGDYGKAPVPLDVSVAVHKELRVIGSNASSDAWSEAVRLASSSAVDLSSIPVLVMAFADWPAAIEAARTRRAPRVVLRHRAADR